MADETPQQIVSSKCIAYTQALLAYRRSVLTDEGAALEGQNLFVWFRDRGALTPEKAPIAGSCVDLGVTLLKTSIESYDRITERVRSSYGVYAGNG